MTNNRNTHLYICLLFYVASLFFPGFYIHASYEPQSAAQLLLYGWLGPLDGHFSWFANPLLFLALITYQNKEKSFKFALAALAAAFSFLLTKKIIVSELPSWSEINGYGIGYAFWVASITSLVIGQYIQHKISNQEKTTKILKLILAPSLLAIFAAYVVHYSYGEDSRLTLEKNRISIFTSECRKSKTIINKTMGTPKSLYINANNGMQYTKSNNGKWRRSSCCGIPLGAFNMPTSMEFIEKNNDYHKNSAAKFIIINKGDDTPKENFVLSSNYGVFTYSANIDRKYNIDSVSLEIANINTREILAKTNYAFNGATGELCSDLHKEDYFFHYTLVQKVFNFKHEP